MILIDVLFFRGIRARFFTYLKSRQRRRQGKATSDLDDCCSLTADLQCETQSADSLVHVVPERFRDAI